MKIPKKKLDLSWLGELDKKDLTNVLLEYDLIQKSFVPWLCLTMANARNERVGQLLLPNLMEECGDYRKQNSHHDLYLKMLGSNNIDISCHAYSKLTLDTAREYTELFSSDNTYRSLCVIGPGIEAVSSDFLTPLYLAVRKLFGDSRHLIYFTIHLSEMEDEHVNCIEQAIELVESDSPEMRLYRAKYEQEGIALMQRFWDGLREQIIT